MAKKTKPRARDKIIARRDLRKRIAARQRKGEKIVFTSGCYDLLHVGHLRSFEQARALGDALVVGLNRDKRVRELKGSGRPVVSEKQRAELIAGLECVDWVVLFGEKSAAPLIRALQPDIACKGGDYRDERIPEQDAAESVGGRFVHLRQIPGVRTTNLLERVRLRR
ncbi:MAG: adenylyltransferase/cytidyltransferase family protein [bacterium]|nr:adenylyltransferase/cytidyltransferase family protein [bacterium]